MARHALRRIELPFFFLRLQTWYRGQYRHELHGGHHTMPGEKEKSRTGRDKNAAAELADFFPLQRIVLRGRYTYDKQLAVNAQSHHRRTDWAFAGRVRLLCFRPLRLHRCRRKPSYQRRQSWAL